MGRTLGKIMIIILPLLCFIGLIRAYIGFSQFLPNGSSIVSAFSGCPNLLDEFKNISIDLTNQLVRWSVWTENNVGFYGDLGRTLANLVTSIWMFIEFLFTAGWKILLLLFIPVRVVVWIFSSFGYLITI